MLWRLQKAQHSQPRVDKFRCSTGDAQSGVMFHSGSGQHMDFDKLARQVVRPMVESLNIDWYGWHGFRRGIASNLYELGADEKIVQRVLRHAKSHVTKDRYIKAFDPAVMAAMKKLEATVDLVNQSAPRVHQIQFAKSTCPVRTHHVSSVLNDLIRCQLH